MKIVSLNVRTLAHAGCLQPLKMDLAKYDLDILGIQEAGLDLRIKVPSMKCLAKQGLFAEGGVHKQQSSCPKMAKC